MSSQPNQLGSGEAGHWETTTQIRILNMHSCCSASYEFEPLFLLIGAHVVSVLIYVQRVARGHVPRRTLKIKQSSSPSDSPSPVGTSNR
ncbi:hypothetical protein A0H81_10424 [Grifola frondosa]|uniref:Uncharacterized protein n=1 Tax=Grifola frondosa TaxID=5627 RepID=A0A1C7LZ26_GRIFR|nr:hypothetical protein A0H81_10424 [Grifola frondosa]